MTEISQLDLSEVQSEPSDVDIGGPEWSPVSFLQSKAILMGRLAVRVFRLDEVAANCNYINKALYESAKSCNKFRERAVK